MASKHNITDMNEVISFIEEAEQIDKRVQINAKDAAEALKSSSKPRLIDVRTPAEWQMSKIPGAELITEELSYEIMNLPKETPMIFYCHTGVRSMDAASYFAGHGFSNVKSLTGGIDEWSQAIDASIPRYEAVRDPNTGRGVLRPLRSVVSQAEGCVTK